MWGQWEPNCQRFSGCTTGWKWDRSGTGSPVIRALQAHLGLTADGIIGPDTANAIIRRYGNGICDGRLDAGGPAIKGLQRAINAGSL
ncbi:peptidoglycan-binding domain-containing protein [Collinsella vaginalis]|uniref:peptidoglycan-binding domain-containing protein n=1 Tax=Collinsella vaginalis TaxID=1870987 RepID=UPI001181685F|nr:peptidoglycan-binding domain-containing protein [Collinsella vaginalis]